MPVTLFHNYLESKQNQNKSVTNIKKVLRNSQEIRTIKIKSLK